jgi:hypothetical protein
MISESSRLSSFWQKAFTDNPRPAKRSASEARFYFSNNETCFVKSSTLEMVPFVFKMMLPLLLNGLSI